jgi:hypothetical protein
LSRFALQLCPVVGLIGLLTFFGAFEYFRSWQLYQGDFDSLAEFTLWRVAGYFTTAHNNGAMALEIQSPLPLPFWTLRPIWEFPGVYESGIGYPALTGVDPKIAHLDMLRHHGTIELNNEGGLFMPFVDYGLLGYLAFWLASGFFASGLYRKYVAGTITGVAFYPIVLLAILNVPLILFLFIPAGFPPLVLLLVIVLVADRATRSVPTGNTNAWVNELDSLFKGGPAREELHHG